MSLQEAAVSVVVQSIAGAFTGLEDYYRQHKIGHHI